MSSAVATVVLAAIPSPDRGVWYLGPVPIRAYALCIIAGIVIAVVWGERRFVARGGEAGVVMDVAVFAVPFGLVGGRLYHVATDWQTYFGPGGDPVDALKIWQGGLGIWGAVALGAVGAWIGCRRRGVPLPFFADAVAPGIVVAQAVGRVGNWFNQELYGAPTTLPWGLEIYRRINPATGAPDPLAGVALDHTPVEVVHPTFLYELLWNLAVAALVVLADRRFRLGHGRAFAIYVAGYCLGRFFIEQMRTDPATRVFGDLRINVVVSAVVFLAAVLYLVAVRAPREVLDRSKTAGDRPSVGPEKAAVDAPAPEVSAAIGASAATAGATATAGPGADLAGSRTDSSTDGQVHDRVGSRSYGSAGATAHGPADRDGGGPADAGAGSIGREAESSTEDPAPHDAVVGATDGRMDDPTAAGAYGAIDGSTAHAAAPTADVHPAAGPVEGVAVDPAGDRIDRPVAAATDAGAAAGSTERSGHSPGGQAGGAGGRPVDGPVDGPTDSPTDSPTDNEADERGRVVSEPGERRS